jgi:hypothetical protein
VRDDHHAVGREVHVGLERVGARLERAREPLERVLGLLGGRAAVPIDDLLHRASPMVL